MTRFDAENLDVELLVFPPSYNMDIFNTQDNLSKPSSIKILHIVSPKMSGSELNLSFSISISTISEILWNAEIKNMMSQRYRKKSRW